MGKIVMPKNSALLHEIEAVLEIYYDADGWLGNEEYKNKLKEKIGADQYQSSYTKKAQITSYYGFTEWEDIDNAQSKRRITGSGKIMYSALKKKDINKVNETILKSLETVVFGRNNFGAPSSNSDVEAPNLFIRASLDLDYLTYKEFAYLLWAIADNGKHYTDSLADIRVYREKEEMTLDQSAEKYVDCKPIMMLERWGFLYSGENSIFGKKITVEKNVMTKYRWRLRNLKIYNVDKIFNLEEIDNIARVAEEVFPKEVIHADRIKEGKNILLYGVPGSGKSYTINEEYGEDRTKMERIVFHPDYMNTDFIGQIIPKIQSDKTVSYEFSPGPFTRIIKKAFYDPKNMYYLVIEEINRGNAPAIFGEVFQLLDRDKNGKSMYSVSNSDVAMSLFDDPDIPIFIPSNLTILATMNTADQNVFTLDTAFQRRWNMKLIENDVKAAIHADVIILDTGVTWKFFNTTINEIILDNSNVVSSEDKRLGAYFITPENLTDVNEFSEKVIKYLWDDVFKFNRYILFSSDYRSLDAVLQDFKMYKRTERFSIFVPGIEELFANEALSVS